MRLDERVVTAFLRRCRIARIATVSAKGTPQVMPLWFVADRGRIYMNNAATSPTVRNIARNPRVVVLLAGTGAAKGRTLRVRGIAGYRHGTPPGRIVRKLAVKYYLSPGALASALRHAGRLTAMFRYYAERTGASGMIEVTPEEVELLDSPWTRPAVAAATSSQPSRVSGG